MIVRGSQDTGLFFREDKNNQRIIKNFRGGAVFDFELRSNTGGDELAVREGPEEIEKDMLHDGR